MELKQKLDDNQRALADNEKRLQHWQDKHAQLRLHRIESDLDDEEEGEEGSKAASPAPAAADEADRTVGGPEDGAKPRSGKKSREGSADAEESDDDVDEDLALQEYPPDELRGIDKEGIKAEIVLYEGELSACRLRRAVLTARVHHRASAEGHGQRRRARRVPQARARVCLACARP